MFTTSPISRHGQSIQFGFSQAGLHILLAKKNHYKSEIVMNARDLPLDWKRAEMAEAARIELKRYDFSSDFFIVGISGYLTADEKPLYCLDGGFRKNHDNEEWYELRISVTTYGDYQAFEGTRSYWITLRKTEVEKIAELMEGYWKE